MSRPRRRSGRRWCSWPAAVAPGVRRGRRPSGGGPAAGCGPAPTGRWRSWSWSTPGRPPPSSAVSLVAPGTKGADALAAAIGQQEVAHRLGGSPDKGAGFVCGLLGVPATGCTSAVDAADLELLARGPGGRWRYSSTGLRRATPSRDGAPSRDGRYGRPAARPRIAPPGRAPATPALASRPPLPLRPTASRPPLPPRGRLVRARRRPGGAGGGRGGHDRAGSPPPRRVAPSTSPSGHRTPGARHRPSTTDRRPP